MAQIKYLNINLEVVRKLGCDEAILYSYLLQVGRSSVRDRHGYFAVDSRYVGNALGMDRFKLRRLRERLVREGLIQYKVGRNQNAKPKYKLL